MSRYIDADLLLENLIETAKGLPEEDRAPYLFCALLIDEEGKHPADVVEVVRCKDCEHWYLDADCGMACEFTNMRQPEDGFCNWGVKDGEQE